MLVKGMKEPANDAAKVQRLLEKGLKIAAAMAEHKAMLAEVETELLEVIAKYKARGNRDPVSLVPKPGDPRGVSVKWNKKYRVHVQAALALKDKLKAAFAKVFSEKVEISRARSFSAFMESAQPPELEKMKEAIQECVEVTFPAKPSIKWVLEAEGNEEDDE